MVGKMLIEKGTAVDPERLADSSVSMKEIAV
jgi:hypothetical protein